MEGRGHAPESVTRMQAKAAQLAEELRLAQTGSQPLTTNSSAALGCEPALGAAWCTSTACTTGSLLQQAGGTPPTPAAAFRRLSQANLAVVKQPGATADVQHLTALHCQKLEAELQLWKRKHADAVKELDRRQDSYMRREEQLKLQLEAIIQTQEAGDSSSSDGSSSSGQASNPGTSDGSQPTASSSKGQKVQKPLTLQEMQEQVLNGLDDLLQRQKLQMRTEEAQQLRQFRSRLAEIEGQLQACKQAAAAHQGDWMDKTVALREELAHTQEIASKLDAMYKLAEEEAAQYRVQFKAQEDDRQHLVRRLIAVKQENSQLRQEQSTLQEELDAIIALALEAESGRPAEAAVPNMWGSTALHAAGARPSTSDSSLAAAIIDVVSRHGSSSSVQSAGSAGARIRPMTAGSGRQRSQAPGQRVRPWSAAAPQQHGRVQSSTEVGEQGVLSNTAAVQAKMDRYSHVIQQLKKLLDLERRQLRQARSCYTAELSRRTELQGLLLSSIQQAKQQHRAAETAVTARQRQHQQSSQLLPWTDERPKSTAAQSRPVSCRLMTGHSGAAAAVGSSQLLSSGRQQSCSRPGSVVQAADGQSAGFDQTAWEQLLEQLLVRRDVLELLFSRAFPDFMDTPQGHLQGGGSQQGPDAQQLHERSAACQHYQQQNQQQHQQLHHQQEPQQYGLGETSPPDTDFSGVLLDEGLECSNSDGNSNGMDTELRAHAAAAEAAASRGAASGVGEGAAVDESCDAAVVSWNEQQQQQHEDGTVEQQPTENAQVTLGGLCAPVMPRFPARQPLHPTVVRRPRSGLVQHQPDTDCTTRRPASAAAGSQAVQLRRTHSPARPATAACRQPGALGQQQQQQQLLGQPAAAGIAAVAGACQRPGSSSSRKGIGPAQVGWPLSAGSKHVWAADAAVITGSFLSSS